MVPSFKQRERRERGIMAFSSPSAVGHGTISASCSSPFLHRIGSRGLSSVQLTGRKQLAAFQRCAGFVWHGNGALRRGTVVCRWQDFIGADMLGFDLGKWYRDVEEYGAIAIYPPPEGGHEGRYATRLKNEGYHFLNMTARGLGDLESCLTKVHAVRPPHLGRQEIVRWYFPPEIDYRLSVLPENSKGLVLWLIEAHVLSKTELQFLALLPALRPKVKVIAECGSWRSFRWKPLKKVAGLPLTQAVPTAEVLSPMIFNAELKEGSTSRASVRL